MHPHESQSEDRPRPFDIEPLLKLITDNFREQETYPSLNGNRHRLELVARLIENRDSSLQKAASDLFNVDGVLCLLGAYFAERDTGQSTFADKKLQLAADTINYLQSHWNKVPISNEEWRADFYSDNMLGYDVCEYICSENLRILSIEEDLAQELFDALLQYHHLNYAHMALGDITKRIESAISTVACHSDLVQDLLDIWINTYHTETNVFSDADICDEIRPNAHAMAVESLERIAGYAVDFRNWQSQPSTDTDV